MAMTEQLGPSTPCILCEKGLLYSVFKAEDRCGHCGHKKSEELVDQRNTDCIQQGNNFRIIGGYNSAFDGSAYEAIICDDCMDKLIQRRYVTYLGEAE